MHFQDIDTNPSVEEIRRTALTAITNAKRKAQSLAGRDRDSNREEFQPGDMVLVQARKRGKFGSFWEGPYPLLAKVGPQLFVIRRPRWGALRETTVHCEKLRRFNWRRHRISTMAGLHYVPPLGVKLRISSIPAAGWGAFTTRARPAQEVLGELRGEVLPLSEAVKRHGDKLPLYTVPLTHTKVLDFADPHRSSWPRFINGTSPMEDANVEFVLNGDIFEVRTRRPLIPGEELLRDYGSTYPWPSPPGASHNASLRKTRKSPRLRDSAPPQAANKKRKVGRPNRPPSPRSKKKAKPSTFDSGEEVEAAEPDVAIIPKEGDMVICRHPDAINGWFLGKATDIGVKHEGYVEVWGYGTYDLKKKVNIINQCSKLGFSLNARPEF